jgi:2-succinyl-5-enolpyruvyl-6-hydroxy-3-cyclohexene-1-carboxylate synthase
VNPSTALARVLVDELVRCGVREAVLCPGSRNAPLSFALHDADAAGRLRLHVRIDERTAGFLALGLAKASGSPVPVVTTSGTATANLHPAVIEASHSGVPLLVLTADRPPELRGTGANQTIDQVKLYGDAVRSYVEISAPDDRVGQVGGWRALVGRVVASATGALTLDPGPVHLNVPLREPLVPEPDDAWAEPLDGRPGGGPWVTVGSGLGLSETAYAGDPRTLVVLGDCPAALAVSAAALAHERNWPLVAESVASPPPGALPGVLLQVPSFVQAHRPSRVLVVGRPTLSRAVGALLRDPEVEVDVIGAQRWADPGSVARTVASASVVTGAPGSASGDEPFVRAWREAGDLASRAIDRFLDSEPWATGPHVARAVLDALSPASVLVVGASSPVRDLDVVAGPWLPGVVVLANRGASGIDGTVSTALGAALAHQRDGGGPAYALMGDLTFLHDATGLLIGPAEPRPDLCIVVVNDDGGGIFGLLEQGAPEHAASFERVFGTPTGTDLAAVCAASRTPYTLASSLPQLRAALAPAPGLRVVEVRTDRSAARDLHARLRAAVADALAPDALAPDS